MCSEVYNRYSSNTQAVVYAELLFFSTVAGIAVLLVVSGLLLVYFKRTKIRLWIHEGRDNKPDASFIAQPKDDQEPVAGRVVT